jgi:hypothetical protein
MEIINETRNLEKHITRKDCLLLVPKFYVIIVILQFPENDSPLKCLSGFLLQINILILFVQL